MPAAEVDVSLELVSRLLAAQHPDLAHLPLEVMANGWDNLIRRLGRGWARARGWALALSLAFLAHSADNPLIAGIGQRTLEAVLA
jgi:hypothetical protein